MLASDIKLHVVSGKLVANLEEMSQLAYDLEIPCRYLTMKYALGLLIDGKIWTPYSMVSNYYFEECEGVLSPECYFLEEEGARLIFDCQPSMPYGYIESLHDYEGIDEDNFNILVEACDLENDRRAYGGALAGYSRFSNLRKPSISWDELIRKGLEAVNNKIMLLNSLNLQGYSHLMTLLANHGVAVIGDHIVEGIDESIINEIKANDSKDHCAELRHFVDVYSTEVIDVVLWKYDLI